MLEVKLFSEKDRALAGVKNHPFTYGEKKILDKLVRDIVQSPMLVEGVLKERFLTRERGMVYNDGRRNEGYFDNSIDPWDDRFFLVKTERINSEYYSVLYRNTYLVLNCLEQQMLLNSLRTNNTSFLDTVKYLNESWYGGKPAEVD